LISCFHTYAKSLYVTGTPSLQTACFLIFTAIVWGFFLMMLALWARSGTNEKSGFWMYSPRYCVPTVQDVHVLLHPLRKPFKHGGSCSAPNTTCPPFLGLADVLAEPPPTNTAATSATSAIAAKPNRCM